MTDHSTLLSAIERGDLDAVRTTIAAAPELVRARDDDGATALHHAAFHGHRAIAELLIDSGAELNARDGMHQATPAGWAINYLRERGALLAIEIEDALFAIRRGDAELLARLIMRHPALADATDRDARPLAEHAADTANPEIMGLFPLRRDRPGG
jgi:ankyrin repeat protein